MGTPEKLLCFVISGLLLLLGSAAAQRSFRPRAVALLVSKDASTNQYLTRIRQRTPSVPLTLAVDLGADTTWTNCASNYVSSSYRAASCGSPTCRIAGPVDYGCWRTCNAPQGPGCNNNTCSAFASNPFPVLTSDGEVAQDVISLASIQGSHPGPLAVVHNFTFVCGPTGIQSGLAAGTTGLIGLGRSPVGFPLQLAAAFNFPRRFAVCLPSSAAHPGLIVFGNVPFNVIPGLTVPTLLTYTPLYVNPRSREINTLGRRSPQYYIGLRSITVGDHQIPINTTLLGFQGNGDGGTSISTVHRFTVLHPSIYRALTSAFIREAESRRIRRVVPAVAPFDVCFQIRKTSRLVPHINLELDGANRPTWTITGLNSLVQVNENVACLGFAAAAEYEVASIIIGALQIEDTLLEFDIARSRLGFSHSLLGHGTTCSNHNFTSTY